MAGAEFSLIQQLKKQLGSNGKDVRLGMGDDAAWLDPAGRMLLVSTDTLVAGRHFFADVSPQDLAWKALAVNLSDLAAMGGEARWCLLNLALPAKAEGYENWIEWFAQGWRALADQHNVVLVGGDTVSTDGPLTLSITVMGLANQGVMRRDAARPDDIIWVTGTLGDAAAALDWAFAERGQADWTCVCSSTQQRALEARRLRPTPRLDFALAAQAGGVACALDCSDGFLADLQHILDASDVRAQVALDTLPVSPELAECLGSDRERWQRWPLCGGDDYELILCAPPALSVSLQETAAAHALRLTPVGKILAIADPHGPAVALTWQGQQIDLPISWGHEHVF